MGEPTLDRRKFLQGAAAGGAAAIFGSGLFANRADAASRAVAASRALTAPRSRNQQPNIVFIVLDEMRFPTVFPAGIHDAGQFLATFMPHLHGLWDSGVKFRHHYSAGVACSPGRAAFATGLYPHQTWMLQTRKGSGSLGPPAPSLKRPFPTYGKLLRDAGYETPYVGKWHLSDSPSDPTSPAAALYLREYGFQGLTVPDIIGANGDGAKYDGEIASTAMQWLEQRTSDQPPFCMTVSFVNAHDREYFWGGIEADQFNALYDSANPPVSPIVHFDPVPSEINPPALGYPTVPPNWESVATLKNKKKPSTQLWARAFTELVWGGITDDPTKTGADDFELREYPLGNPKIQAAYAPYTYWQKGLDSYTQIMHMVDDHIGSVLASIPPDVAANTVFVMTSDHGDFSGAHGFPANKAGTAYEEAFNVPLIVSDRTGRFTGDTDVLREQLTSSVDLVPMFATLATGNQSWMRGDLASIYSRRLDLTTLLRSNRAKGRDAVVMATDEVVPKYYNFNGSPRYILALRTERAKLGVYVDWRAGTAVIDPDTVELEFYDYATEGGRLELDNQPDHPQARRMLRDLFTRYVPQEMEQPLPGALRLVSELAKRQFIAYVAALDALGERELTDRKLSLFTPFGDPF